MTVSEILRLDARGEGVASDGRRVPMSAPGDLVEDGNVSAGPHRVVPPCRHFPECGGCQLQHVDDAAYADFLAARIAEALASHGIGTISFRAPHISPPRSRRRASLSAERRGNQILLGFKAEASHRIVDMRECHILDPELFALVPPLRVLLAKLMRPRSKASVRMTLADQGPDLLLEGIDADTLPAIEKLTDFAREFGLVRLALKNGEHVEDRWQPEPPTITFGGVPVRLPHNAFLQATREGEAALVSAVKEGVGKAGTVADLFAGLGTFALTLQGRVLAAEGDREAASALKRAGDLDRRPVFVDHRDLFRRPIETKDLDRFEAVVLDPPRAGAKDQAIRLAASAVPRIVYVSCNPATFGRDAKALVDGGYRIEWVLPVGQFRWSTHVELVALLTRE